MQTTQQETQQEQYTATDLTIPENFDHIQAIIEAMQDIDTKLEYSEQQ